MHIKSHKGSRTKKRSRKGSKYYFGESDYQKQVNDLTGAMGPTVVANWAKVGSMGETTANLDSQPLYVDIATGNYVTAYDQSSVWNPSVLERNVAAFGKGRKKTKRSKTKKTKKTKRSKTRK